MHTSGPPCGLRRICWAFTIASSSPGMMSASSLSVVGKLYQQRSALLLSRSPPMVGSTWPRVRTTLESDCLPVLSQGTASLHLVVDLLIAIFIVAAHIRCLVIGVVLVCLIDRLMFSLSYMWPWRLFSYWLSGPLTWYLVSHDGLPLVWLVMLPLPPISADALWDSIRFLYWQLLYLDRGTLAIGTIMQANVAFSEMYK